MSFNFGGDREVRLNVPDKQTAALFECRNGNKVDFVIQASLNWREKRLRTLPRARAAKKKNEKRNSQTCLVLQFITYDVWSSCRFYHRLIGRFYVSTPVGQETEKKMGYSVTHSSRSWAEETCAARIAQHWPWTSHVAGAYTKTVLDPISHNHRCSMFFVIIMLQFR